MKIKIQKPFPRIVELFTLTLITLFSSYSANAEIGLSGVYTGLLFSNSSDKTESSSMTKEIQRGHVRGKLGWIINDVIAIEGQLGITTSSDDQKGVVTSGALLRVGKDFGQYKLYGLLGFSNIYYYSDDNGNTSESGGSYGLGIEVFGSKDLAVTLEYLSMVDKSIDNADYTFDALGLGFTYYFTEDKSYFNKNRNKIKSIRY